MCAKEVNYEFGLTFAVLHVTCELESRSTFAGDAAFLCFPADVRTAMILVHAGGTLLCSFRSHCKAKAEGFFFTACTSHRFHAALPGLQRCRFQRWLSGVKMFTSLSHAPKSHLCLLLVTDMHGSPLHNSEHLLEHAHLFQAIKRRLPTEQG